MSSLSAFRLPRLYPIIDTATLAAVGLRCAAVADALLDAGVTMLQYRHKTAWHQRQFDEASAIARTCEQKGVLFVLNDRADYAGLLRVALHVGQEDLPPVAARKVIRDEVLGFSTHNLAQVRRADTEPAEYLSLGPIFATASKLNPDPVVGLDGLEKCRKATAKPLCAIGGITLENAREVLQAGADSVAVISALLPSAGPSPRQIRQHAQKWLEALAAPL